MLVCKELEERSQGIHRSLALVRFLSQWPYQGFGTKAAKDALLFRGHLNLDADRSESLTSKTSQNTISSLHVWSQIQTVCASGFLSYQPTQYKLDLRIINNQLGRTAAETKRDSSA